MTITEKSNLTYQMIQIKIWAEFIGFQSQSTRELRIQAMKLERLCSKWDGDFLFRFDSVKKATKMQTNNDKQIKPQYQTVLSLVRQVAEEARQKSIPVEDIVSKAVAYAKEYALGRAVEKRHRAVLP